MCLLAFPGWVRRSNICSQDVYDACLEEYACILPQKDCTNAGRTIFVSFFAPVRNT